MSHHQNSVCLAPQIKDEIQSNWNKKSMTNSVFLAFEYGAGQGESLDYNFLHYVSV